MMITLIEQHKFTIMKKLWIYAFHDGHFHTTILETQRKLPTCNPILNKKQNTRK